MVNHFLKEQDKYDVVFMDIELPGMNGMETITKLRMVNQFFKFIII